tara:strand:+ start:11012 stop:12502 length:1491 start_codon:yes stop_codon:yes gene_type:complete
MGMNDIRTQIKDELLSLGKNLKDSKIRDLIEFNDPECHVVKTKLVDFDFSKQRLNEEVLEYLLKVPDLIKLEESLESLFRGKIVNRSENRLVSHTLYRNKKPIKGFELIFSEREKIKYNLEKKIISANFKNLICLCIGGSRLGPELLSEFQALNGSVKVYYCSSLDLLELQDILTHCFQSETAVLVSSKSFETYEILKNLEFIKSWFEKKPDVDYKRHLFAISSNISLMTKAGVPEENQFVILDSLGGRFSVWSSVSLPAFVNSGFDSYMSFLEGAYLADQHTLDSPWHSNIPVLMALLSIWNTNSLEINNHGIFSYNFRLRSLAKYIAQLSMESNGKSTNFEGEVSPFSTSQLIWGGYGIESQHSTFQWLMQGKIRTSCDFIGINGETGEYNDEYSMLLSQVIAMAFGEQYKNEPFKSIEGNNPCSILQLKSLDLKSLGFLLTLYEHKIFIESLILGVDPFDQWGVALGKEIAINSRKNKNFFSRIFSSDLLPKS